jgi:glycerol-3-phosphate dehydrogenase
LSDVRQRHPFLTSDQSLRLARAYGSMLHNFVQPDMGEDFGGGLTAREVDWLMTHEWAQTADDIIWRRTKLGLVFNEAQVARIAAYLAS